MSDESGSLLDMSVAALHARPPLTRPAITTVGTSQIAKMELALGRRAWAPGDVTYLQTETRVMKRSGHSRALLVAAGILEETKGHRKADEGTEDEDESLTVGKAREAELFHTWASVVRSGWFANEFESQLDPDSLTYLPPPEKHMPRRHDALCPALSAAGFDGFAHTHGGAFVHLELKCARYKHPFAKSPLPVWWDRGTLPWWYARQNDASMAINCAGHSLLIVGGGWIRGENDPRGDGPIKVFYQRREQGRIAEARSIATATLAAVADLRTTAANAA